MTDYELRMKVAEALGWTQLGPGPVAGEELLGLRPRSSWGFDVVPDWPNDLEACWEDLELGLPSRDAWGATAREWCKAFLKVKGGVVAAPMCRYSNPSCNPTGPV